MRLAGLTFTALAGASTVCAQETLVLDPVVIESAGREERAILDTPVSATIVAGETLERTQAGDFQDLIGIAPGLTIGGGPRGVAQEPNIRGFQDEQIVLRFDGARFNFNQAHRGRFFVDPDIVERVEVVRGGGSTLFGSGALGGVISVETKDVDDLLEPGLNFGARVLGGYATNGEMGRATATLYGRRGAVDALGFVGWRPMGANFEDGAGDEIRSSELDIVNGLFKLGAEPGTASRIEVQGSIYSDEGTVPPNASAEGDPETNVDRDAVVRNFSLGWTHAPAGNPAVDLSVLAYATDLEITEDRDQDGREDETRYETLGFEAVNRSRLDIGAPVTLVYGIEALRDRQEGERNGAERAQFPDAEATTLAAFAEARIALTDRLELTPGLRFDSYERDPDSDDLDRVEEEFWSPRIGISFRPNENWQLYGNVARAFRAPSLTELYADGVHFAAPGFPLGPGTTFTGVNEFVPNPDLEPEKSTQYEIGTRYVATDLLGSGDRLSVSANAYYAEVEDFIDQVVTFIDFDTATGGPTGVAVGGTTSSSNVDAELWGVEAELDYDAGRWFGGLGVTIPRGERDDGSPLGSIPQDRLSATLGLRPLPSLEIGGTAVFAAEKDDVPEGSVPGEAFEVLDLFASWRPDPGGARDVVVRAGIDNVFDETYTIFPNGLNETGRSFKLSVALTF